MDEPFAFREAELSSMRTETETGVFFLNGDWSLQVHRMSSEDEFRQKRERAPQLLGLHVRMDPQINNKVMMFRLYRLRNIEQRLLQED